MRELRVPTCLWSLCVQTGPSPMAGDRFSEPFHSSSSPLGVLAGAGGAPSAGGWLRVGPPGFASHFARLRCFFSLVWGVRRVHGCVFTHRLRCSPRRSARPSVQGERPLVGPRTHARSVGRGGVGWRPRATCVSGPGAGGDLGGGTAPGSSLSRRMGCGATWVTSWVCAEMSRRQRWFLR